MTTIESTPGAYFEVTGRNRNELYRILDGLDRTGGRTTSNDSASADLWGEMQDEWFARHDAAVPLALLAPADVIVAKHYVDEYRTACLGESADDELDTGRNLITHLLMVLGKLGIEVEA